MDIYLILCIVIILGVLGTIVYFKYISDTHIVRVNKKQIMEFKTAMDLTGLPIITFYQGKNKYNFLLDTGSNVSYVNSKSDIEVDKTNVKDTYMGADGVDKECEWATARFYRESSEYHCKVIVADLDAAFTELKNCWGVSVNGILGNDFFVKYKYCLDFKESVVYVRK